MRCQPILLFLFLASLMPRASLADEIDSFPGWLDTISSITIGVQGDQAAALKSDLEQLVRVRVRNEFSALKFESKTFIDAYKEFGKSLDSSELKRRSSVYCLVWVVGKPPGNVAHLVECKLGGYGNYAWPIDRELTNRYLGIAGSSVLKSELEDSIRLTVTALAAGYFESKDQSAKDSAVKRAASPKAQSKPTSPYESTGRARPKEPTEQ